MRASLSTVRDMEGDSKSYNTNFEGGVGLVIGNEGKGISRLVRDKCDGIVSIPMVGKSQFPECFCEQREFSCMK